MNAPAPTAAIQPRLTSLSHGRGCGSKIAPGVLSEILKGGAAMPMPKDLLVGIETADFFMPIGVLSTATIGKILQGGQDDCRAAGVPIAGGRTIDSVEPIYGLGALGLVHLRLVKRNADAQVGDHLILGKPIGVDVLSAALKEDALSAEGYAQMIENSTQLNTPRPDLAALDGVHALTDITGSGEIVAPVDGVRLEVN